MTSLSVNLNKVALLRNARDLDVPSVARAADTCVRAGAQGITVHPRPDGRHIRPADVIELSAITRDYGVELNVEGYPAPEFLELVRRVRPAQCTLVPDAPGQRTSDHGWDVAAHARLLRDTVARLAGDGVRTSVFLDPEPGSMAPTRETGADRVELYTEPYARAFDTPRREETLTRYADAARVAVRCGLAVNAGHDLNLHNLGPLCERIPELSEVSIGHALVADALELGLAGSVRAYLDVLRGARRGAAHV